MLRQKLAGLMKVVGVASIALGSGSCGLPFGPDGIPVELRIVGALAPDPGNPDTWGAPPVVTVQGGVGVVTVRGDFLLPCDNYHIKARAEHDGKVISLSLEIAREPVGHDVEVKYAYEAVLRDVSRGDYTVRVFHELFARSQGGMGLTQVKEVLITIR